MPCTAPGRILLGSALAGVLLLTGCARDGRFQPVSMWNESRLKPYEASPLPGALTSARNLAPGTVHRGERAPDDPLVAARRAGKLVTEIPVPVTRVLVKRGQERFNIYCTPCHGRAGDGEGLVVKRGFPHPPDFAIQRLREAPVGHIYEVITEGYGIMYSYASRVAPADRWAIAAYIRTLQAARPEVPEDVWESERIQAREKGRGNVHRP